MKPPVGGTEGTPTPPCRGWIEGAMGAIRAGDPMKKLCPPALDPKAIRGGSFCRDPLPWGFACPQPGCSWASLCT